MKTLLGTAMLGTGMGLALLAAAGSAMAMDDGDRVDHRLDARGDRIEHHLDQRGARIDQHFDARGDRIDARLARRSGAQHRLTAPAEQRGLSKWR